MEILGTPGEEFMKKISSESVSNWDGVGGRRRRRRSELSCCFSFTFILDYQLRSLSVFVAVIVAVVDLTISFRS